MLTFGVCVCVGGGQLSNTKCYKALTFKYYLIKILLRYFVFLLLCKILFKMKCSKYLLLQYKNSIVFYDVDFMYRNLAEQLLSLIMNV